MMGNMIRQCMRNIVQYYEQDKEMKEIIAGFEPRPTDSLLSLRAKLLILLNEDEITRVELVNKTSDLKGYFGPIPLAKANRFYVALHEHLIAKWVSDECVTLDEFIDDVRMAYLIS